MGALVPVLKTGGSLMWAINYQKLNAITIADAFNLPNIGENLDKLQESTIFSSLDLTRAYHIIPEEESSHPPISFTNPFGTYQYKKMAFGVSNKCSAFSRFMQTSCGQVKKPMDPSISR